MRQSISRILNNGGICMKRIFFVLLLALSVSIPTIFASWEYIGTDSLHNQSYVLPESSKIVKHNEKVLEWTIQAKDIYSDEGKSNMLNIYAQHESPIDGAELASYQIITYHFKAWDNKVGYRIDVNRGYDANGRYVCDFGGWHAFEPFGTNSIIGATSYRALNYMYQVQHINVYDFLLGLQHD
jgi:uncharacterized protein YxeA